MNARQLNSFLNELRRNVAEDTLAKYNKIEVDRVIYGDPNREVQGIAVCWMPVIEAIDEANRLGANIIIAHEPTFYDHWDLEGDFHEQPAIEMKKKLLERYRITVIRCHDVWDVFPQKGTSFAWGDFLGLTEPIRISTPYIVYKVKERRAIDFAYEVLERISSLSAKCLRFYGDEKRIISTIGIGAGCYSDPFHIYKLGAELAVSVDDITRAWIAGEWCRDTGRPLIVVDHGVAEEPGQIALATFLRTKLQGIVVHYLRQGCSCKHLTHTDGVTAKGV